MQEILDNIVDSRIQNLLEIISINYPKNFKNTDIKKELIYIKKHIFWKTKVNISKPKDKDKNKNKDVNKNVARTKFKKKNKTKDKTKDKTKEINKCSGRIWSKYILNSKNMKQINDIEDKFKIDDFNDLDIKDFNSKYIVGLRCSKQKMQNSKYCKLHDKHLIHGDYLKSPNKELCYHFMKDGQYL